MPNPPVHINLARQAAQHLGHEVLEEHLGYYLLGSTSPDVRVITKQKRELYHFTTLDFDEIGEGIQGLFHAHPHLGSASGQSGPMQAFMAGYLTHLLADESWIVNMYRPFFGNREVFPDETLGNVFDRAMQLEMDRQCWDDVGDLCNLLEPPAEKVNIEFIPQETLTDWGQWIVSSIERGFSWERLRFMARRIAGGEGPHPAYHVAEEFVNDAPHGLDRLYQLVPDKNVKNYQETTLDRMISTVGDYLP